MTIPSAETLDVSRETFDRLARFAALVEKWTPRINLISKSSVPHIWDRHIHDSVQLFRLAPDWSSWADLGSGGGFPGLIIAILAAEAVPDGCVTLVESDSRKSTFLRTAARETGINCRVITQRIETAITLDADVLSARALADLTTLLTFAERHLRPGGTAIFPKGISWEKEVETARQQWNFDLEPVTSKTEPGAAILKIKGVSRV